MAPAAVEAAERQPERLFRQPVAQGAKACCARREGSTGVLQRGGHAHNSRRVFRARPQAALLLTAGEQSRQLEALPPPEKPHAFRAVKLVCGDGEQIALPAFHIDRQIPGSLHGVGVEQHTVRAAQAADLLHGLHRADLVVCRHDGDKRRVFPQGRFHFFGAHEAVAVHGQPCYGKAFLLQRSAGAEHGRVFKRRGDEAALSLRSHPVRRGAKRPVVAFRAAGGEEDLLRIGVQAGSKIPPRLLHGAPGLLPQTIERRGVAILRRQERLHRPQCGGRKRRGGCVVRVKESVFRHEISSLCLVTAGRGGPPRRWPACRSAHFPGVRRAP